MRYLIWFARLIWFVLLLGFAVKNDQPVVLRYFFGYEWQASLVVVLLVFFAAGAVLGVLAVLGNLLRQRKQLATLEREAKLRQKLDNIEHTQAVPIQSS
jgi:uncharacterized integral membrane protein